MSRSKPVRIIGYTNTYGLYRTIDKDQKEGLTKQLPTKKSQIETSTAPIEEPAINKPQEPEISDFEDNSEEASAGYRTPERQPEQPILAPPQRKRKNIQELIELYGTCEKSSRTRTPTWKLGEETSRTSGEDIFAVGTNPDHPTHEQVLEREDAVWWAEAREKERMQLRKYRVYEVVGNLPPDTKPVSTKWVYVIKRKANGTIERYKARKVERGFSQIKGVDYDETNAQTMRIETFRILLAMCL